MSELIKTPMGYQGPATDPSKAPVPDTPIQFSWPSLLINEDNITLGNVVRISLVDGNVERLNGWTADNAAAEQFWKAVEEWKAYATRGMVPPAPVP